MEKIRVFTDLIVWRKGHELVLAVYDSTKLFPATEQFGLTSQIKRAAVSITSNIAEGFSRQTKADKIHFYHMALGSCTEVQNQMIIAKDLQFIATNNYENVSTLTRDVHKLLNVVIKSIRLEK